MICYDKLWLMMKQIKPIIESNDFSDYESNVTDPEILKVLSDYRIKRVLFGWSGAGAGLYE